MNDIVPKETLVREGTKGVGSIVGGGLVIGLTFVTGAMVPGLVVGGALAAGGLISAARSPESKIAGIVAAGAGALTAVASLPIPIISSAASSLMWLSGLGLLGAGVFSMVKFFRGLKSRR